MSKPLYVLKYYFKDDDSTVITKLTNFKTVENLLGFAINISVLCDKNKPLAIFDKETKKLLVKGEVKDILKYFLPDIADEEDLREFIRANLSETTIRYIQERGL